MLQPRWKRVLVAEDSPTMQKLSTCLLEREGYQVVLVANGVAAVEAVQEQSFDLVLMDLEMPEMGGVEAARTIQQLHLSHHVPIVGISGSREPLLFDICRRAGMADLIAKPLRIATLRALLHEHCEQQQAVNC